MSQQQSLHSCRRFIGTLCLALVGAGGWSLAQAGTINWGPVQTASINSPYGGIVAGPPDDSTGGFSFASGAATRYGSDADMVVGNDGTIGASGIALSKAGFDSSADAEPSSYLSYLRTKSEGDVFVVQLKSGKHAKIRIDTLTAGYAWYTYSKIAFSYRLEQAPSGSTSGSPSSGNVTYYNDCAKQTWPSGISCGTPVSMNSLWTASDMSGAAASLGCTSLDHGIYYCGSGSAYAGVFVTYAFSGTTTLSRIIYIH